MKRLTLKKRFEFHKSNKEETVIDATNYEYVTEREYEPYIKDHYYLIGEAVEKLAAYEDAEEQGLLLRLPCKVGDTVWCLEEDGCAGYIFIAMSGEHCIVSADYVHCDDIYEQLEEMEDDTENGFEPSVCIFHKDKVFLTKEEAEQALQQIQEET